MLETFHLRYGTANLTKLCSNNNLLYIFVRARYFSQLAQRIQRRRGFGLWSIRPVPCWAGGVAPAAREVPRRRAPPQAWNRAYHATGPQCGCVPLMAALQFLAGPPKACDNRVSHVESRPETAEWTAIVFRTWSCGPLHTTEYGRGPCPCPCRACPSPSSRSAAPAAALPAPAARLSRKLGDVSINIIFVVIFSHETFFFRTDRVNFIRSSQPY